MNVLARLSAPLVLAASALTASAAPSSLPVEGRFPGFAGATGWINSPPLTAEALRGKVVLVDFWTYSCINCLRTLPWLRAWADKYKDAGLVVVGVHSPEFAFEKRPANVSQAVKDLHLGYPIAIDSDFKVWRAFGNEAWPAFYFVDAQGRIRAHQFGEDQYAQAEAFLQQLLAEAGQAAPAGRVAPQGAGTEAAHGTGPVLSEETYLGLAKADAFIAAGGAASPGSKVYEPAAALRLGQWTLGGEWSFEPDHVMAGRAGGRIALRFRARDVHLVLGPAADGRPVRFQVLVDGKPPMGDHGADTDEQGRGSIDRQRLYQLVRLTANEREHVVEIRFDDPGAQAWVFTFG